MSATIITATSTPSARKRGPPAPLTLASGPHKAISATVVINENGDPSPAEPPAMPQLHGTTIMQPAPTRDSRAPGPSRNVKRLSLSISSVSTSQNDTPQSPIVEAPPQPRRHSVATLPNASVSSILQRNNEGDATTSAYADGPIEIMPRIWLGSEDNARDWKGLIERGIKSILNVAKEVSSPFDSAPNHQPIRNVTSAPNLSSTTVQRHTGTYQPAHLQSGRPAMHYLKMPWSHGQSDLVRSGFAEAMQFIDEALARREGVLIHCQCGVSRSATMVIAFVMRAAQVGGQDVPADVQALRGRGMQGAYDFVQKKSKSIGPNMSLIYQLLDYERALRADNSPGKSSFGASEDEEWERQRRQLDSPDQESNEILKEAKELDREMEERRARKLSLASTSSTTSVTGLVVNPTPWRVRYGARSRAASMDSNFTSKSSVSVLSEDPLAEEDEEEERDPTKVTTPDTDATDEDVHCFGMHYGRPEPTPIAEFKPSLPPPSAPAHKVSFGIPRAPPSATPQQVSFPSSISGSSVASRRSNPPRITVTTSITPSPPSATELTVKKEKRRPPPLKDMTPTVPFPAIQIERESIQPSQSVASSASSTASSSKSRRLSSRISSLVPFPVKNVLAAISSPKPTSSAAPTPSASQTLFVFPPSPRTRGVSTPSVLTLTSTPLLSATFTTGIQTPRAGGFRKRTDSRKSWIGLSAVTPTTATARVDVRGQFEA